MTAVLTALAIAFLAYGVYRDRANAQKLELELDDFLTALLVGAIT